MVLKSKLMVLAILAASMTMAASVVMAAPSPPVSPPISPEDLMKGMSGAGSMVAYNEAVESLGDHPTQSDYCKVARSATTAWYDIRLSRMVGLAGIYDLELQNKLKRTRQWLNPSELKIVDILALQMEERVAYYNSLCAHP
jgi:hypothetical protein